MRKNWVKKIFLKGQEFCREKKREWHVIMRCGEEKVWYVRMGTIENENTFIQRCDKG